MTPCSRLHCDDLMVMAAVRYSLTRSSVIVGACADWLLTIWSQLPQQTQTLLERDIREALAETFPHHDCDRKAWEQVLASIAFRKAKDG